MSPTPLPDRPLTSSQVAEYFGVSRSTVHNWAEERRLPFFLTPTGQRRFRREDVERMTTITPAEEHA